MHTFNKLLLAVAFLGSAQVLSGQIGMHYADIGDRRKEQFSGGLQVLPLASDSFASSYLIRVVEGVPVHYHATHTESIMVLSGSGKMLLGTDTVFIKAGDFLVVPQGVHHGVWTTSDQALEVISIQAPFFDGRDRIWVNEP